MTTIFKNLLLELGEQRPSINYMCFNSIQMEEGERVLGRVFSEKEVFEALTRLCGDKALGPNGFSMGLWLLIWDFVKN